jgi:hypothetical protein
MSSSRRGCRRTGTGVSSPMNSTSVPAALAETGRETPSRRA